MRNAKTPRKKMLHHKRCVNHVNEKNIKVDCLIGARVFGQFHKRGFFAEIVCQLML